MLPVATAIQYLSRRSAIALSLHNKTKCFSSSVNHVFRFAFVGVLIILERKKDKAKRKRVVICKQLFPASSLLVRPGVSKNFPAKN